MNRADRAVVAGLALVLAFAAIAIAGPAFTPPSTATTPSARPTPTPAIPYREGALGRPVAISPLGARSQVDRDLVALVFEGLTRLDADGQPIPALATSWSSDTTGGVWTFRLRPDATWQDGQPVTAGDVVFTVETLSNADYHGPGAGSWQGITATAVDDHTVRFDIEDPFAGFLDLTTQPIAPQHLLGDTPPAAMAGDPFGEAPIGSGPYAVVELDRDHAVLQPAGVASEPGPGNAGSSPSASGAPPVPSDPLGPNHPTPRPTDTRPGLSRLEFRFFDTTDQLVAAYRAGELDAASGLAPLDVAGLAAVPGTRLVRDPSTTIAAVLLNLRPSHLEFRDPKVRLALLEGIDRPAIVGTVFGGLASRADAFVPPTSWAFNAAANPIVKRDTKAAGKALTAAGWKKAADGWRAPSAQAATPLEVLVPSRAANPTLYAVGSKVVANWRALGLAAKLVEVDPATMAADHLRTGEFSAAVVEIAVGHDPDLYPLFASSQTQTGGANVIGLQDPVLDGLLEAARTPAVESARITAFSALETRLTGGTYTLPIAWPDSVVAVRDRVVGPAPRTVADGSERFWDVLTWRLADDR
jgi:peptide/nickel transport system substrate-binding protein